MPFTILPTLSFLRKIAFLSILIVFLLLSASEGWAKRPPETRNQEKLEIRKDMHGRDLNGYEFIKVDLRGVDLSESDLRGAVFNNSQLQGADLHGSDMKDVLAYSTDFEDADLTDANLSNALLMESSFKGAQIEGADFSDAIINRIQQRQLCLRASGTNSKSGITTDYSLGC
tara:strand:+ start:1339 stop:1854 length:516 start_codon:yes stop_codon:yes gene_type:complete